MVQVSAPSAAVTYTRQKWNVGSSRDLASSFVIADDANGCYRFA